MSEHISIVIPNWNGAHLLGPCLDTLRQQTFSDFVTYVVDNGSTDGSLELLEEKYPEVVVLKHDENLGFSAAMNTGIERSHGRLIAALNNDTEVHKTWLENIASAMEDHPGAGFCASQLMDFTQRDRIDSLGDGYYPFGVSFKVGSRALYPERGLSVFEIQSACAAASVYRRDMLDSIGTFDLDFFAYMEDVDLGLRAQSAGYSCIFVPGAIVYHMGSATSGGDASAFSVRLTTCNTYQVILKNVPGLLVPVWLACTFCAQLAALISGQILGKPRPLKKYPGAWFTGLKAAFHAAGSSISKRKKFHPNRKETTFGFLATTWKTIERNRSLKR